MSGSDGFVIQLVGALSRALTPLAQATASAQALGDLLARLGWVTPANAAVLASLEGANAAIERLASDVDAGAAAPTLLADGVAAISAIAALADAGAQPGAGAPFDDPAFWSALPQELIALLISEDLEAHAPRAYGFLSVLGVLSTSARAADAPGGRQAYAARSVDWSALGRVAASPATWFADVYGWGSRLDHVRLLDALAALGAGLGGASSRAAAHPSLLAPYVAPDNPDRGLIQRLSISPFVMESPTLATLIKPALLLLPLPPDGAPSSPPEGLLLWPMVTGAAQATVDLGPAATLTLDGDFQATPQRFALRPGGTVIEQAGANAVTSARVDIEVDVPFIMGGAAGSTRLELKRAHFGIRAGGGSADAELVIDAALDEASAVLDPGGADSFLRAILGDAQTTLSVASGLTWSSLSGLTFAGTSLPAVTIPTDIRIGGVLTVSEILLALDKTDAGAAVVTVAIDGALVLGPFSVIVEAMGLEVRALPTPLEAPGNFGLLDLGFGFKPPTGLGLGVDAEGVVSGGGFLSIDAAAGRYAGVAALQMIGLGISVIAIVETKLPEDPDRWSLFLSVIADFTPVQLGFGFTLNGIGGFMGLHRTLDELALAEGVREGRLDSLLFPPDPIGDVTRILADIEAYFPTLADHHAFGAMAKFGWGTPTLITAQLGIVVAVPDLEIAVIGELAAVLPKPDAALLELHMGVVGFIDVAAGTFWIAASIYDSQLVGLTLSGDMAMYLATGDEPYFLMSVGGFHPAWSAPASVPSSITALRRMAASIDMGESLQIGVESYFAVTSNTLQFGAEAYAVAKARVVGINFTAEGWFGFDVLLTLTPFALLADVSAGVAIRAKGETLAGIQLDLHLEGPQPWYGSGRAEFKFLLWEISFAVEVGGRPAAEAAQTIDLWPLLEAALADPASWIAPDAGEVLPEVSLRPIDPLRETGLWLQPDQSIELRQRMIPLDRVIDAYGALAPVGQTRFDVEAAGLATGSDASWAVVQDWFAGAQFTTMRSTDRLSAPSFELMDAGVTLSSGGISVAVMNADVASVAIEYEEAVMTEAALTHPKVRRLNRDRLGLGLQRPRSTMLGPAARRAVQSATFSLAPTRYAVVEPLRGFTIARGPGAPMMQTQSYADAIRLRGSLDGNHPAPEGRLRVVPSHHASIRIDVHDLPDLPDLPR